MDEPKSLKCSLNITRQTNSNLGCRLGTALICDLLRGLFFLSFVIHTSCASEKKQEEKGSPLSKFPKKHESLGDPRPSNQYRAFLASEIKTWNNVNGLNDSQPFIDQNLKEIFCQEVYKLKLAGRFDESLAMICTNEKPNDTFDKLDRYGQQIVDTPLVVQIAKKDESEEFLEANYAVISRFPVKTSSLRRAKIVDYLYRNSEFSYLRFTGEVLAELGPESENPLHIGKWQMSGIKDITTPNGAKFTARRNTEMNLYQVEGGNPNIGLGAEHLLDQANPDYKAYQTVNISLTNLDGSSSLISLIRAIVRHHGQKAIVERIFNDLALSQAIHVYDGVVEEKRSGIID